MSNETTQSPDHQPTQAELDNRSKQLDPENDRFWQSRGYPERPENWKTLVPQHQPSPRKK